MRSLVQSIKFMNDHILTSSNALVTNSHRAVNPEQIERLRHQGNYSPDWSKVFIVETADSFTLSRIRRCNFDGTIFISLLTGWIPEIDGVALPSGLYDSYFAGTCFLSDSCRVSTTTLVSNVYVGPHAAIINCGSVTSKAHSPHSKDCLDSTLKINVGPETGGRSVTVSAGMNYLTICRQLFCDGKENGHNLKFQSHYSIIGDRTILMGCDRVYNCIIGPVCKVLSSSLDACILSSTLSAPISVTAGAKLSHCIMNEACSASNNCLAEHVYMSEHSSIGDVARVAHCVLGPDSSVAGGECHHSLLGPFVGFHHQSLLIAAVWPQGRGNIAYGAKVGANHTGRVSDQECWPGEGIFFGLGSAVKFPSNLLASPYSILSSGVVLPPQKIAFPFSLISTSDRPLKLDGADVAGTAVTISPGWVILSNPYMIDRAAKKYTGRRKAQLHKTDFPILRPYMMDLVLTARDALSSALSRYGSMPGRDPLQAYSSREIPGLGLCLLSPGDLAKGIKAYTSLLKRYALHGLLYLILWFLNHEPAETATLKAHILLSLDAQVKSLGSSSSAWGGLEEDLQLLAMTGPESLEPIDLVATDSHCIAVHIHQLRVLMNEYPALNLRDSLARFPNACTSVAPYGIRHMGTTLPLLYELIAIEGAHAAAVTACRGRDGTKGRSIIPDYDTVNPAGGDVVSDAVVSGSVSRAAQMAQIITVLFVPC